MKNARCLAAACGPVVLASTWVITPMLLKMTRSVVVWVFGEARVHGTMHLKTPLEEIHYRLAPPTLRVY